MSIKPGRYNILPVIHDNRFVATGPVPLIYPPPPVPLRTMSERWKDVFEVIPDGGDKYIFKLLALRMTVAWDRNDNVRLGPFGEKPVQWAVDRASGDGISNIKLPNEDKCWTAGGHDEYAPIRLERANGNPTQQWRFVPAEQDW